MGTLLGAFRRHYGASPLHLIAFIASIALTGAAVAGWFAEPEISIRYILYWFVGAIVAHDMIVLPFYSAIDRVALALARRRPRPSAPGRAQAGEPAPVRTPGWVYVRVPLALSALLLLVFGAEILREGNATFHIASGQTQNVYLLRYLITVGVLFGLSGLAYLRSSARASSRIP